MAAPRRSGCHVGSLFAQESLGEPRGLANLCPLRRRQARDIRADAGACIAKALALALLPSQPTYAGINMRPQLVHSTVCVPDLTRCCICVGCDIRQAWHRPRSTLATASPRLARRRPS